MSADNTTAELAAQMKLGMRRLASGVSIITAQTADGERYAMTASSVTSVSATPASLLVCVNQDARLASALTLGQAFAVNILQQSHQAIAQICGSGAQNSERFQSPLWQFPSQGAPYLQDAEAVFQCTIVQLVPHGTHIIVVGNIGEVAVSASAYDPLIYANGRYDALASH